MHKNPCGTRFIIACKLCSTTMWSSKLVFSVVKLINTQKKVSIKVSSFWVVNIIVNIDNW